MLNSKNLNDRTYEELIAEAIAQIPLYTKEWTNYNPSDPGITILENLSAFHVLQQEKLNEVTKEIRQQLLKMAGFTAREGHPASVLLMAEPKQEKVVMLPNQQVQFQDLNFEFVRESVIGRGRISGVYMETGGKIQDHSVLLEEYLIPGGRYLFGEKPQAGQNLYFVINSLPDAFTQLIISIDVQQEYPRNKLCIAEDYPCADIVFSLLTNEGFVELEVLDTTFHFLQSGAFYIRMPQQSGKISGQFLQKGYLLKAALVRADYNIAPKVQSIKGYLTEVIQKDTKSIVLPFKGAMRIQIQNALTETGYLFIYVREKEGDYYAYSERKEAEESGRYFRKVRLGYGRYEIVFDWWDDGYGPVPGDENAVMAVCCTKELLLHRKLGKVCGYDEQHLDLTPFFHILPESFSLMSCKQDEKGIERYAFFTPEMSQENTLSYTLYGEEAKAVIHDGGFYEEAMLSIAGCAVYQGERGNIRKDNEGVAVVGSHSYRFRNPSPGYGGSYAESVEEVRKRFVKDMHSPASLVTEEDYETIVQRIPGLSIHKVKASIGKKRNTVCLAVKPYSQEPFPKLLPLECRVIEQYLDKRRLLTTKVTLVQPVYLPIRVTGIIYKKQHYSNVYEKILEILQNSLDYITTEKEFGALISFHEIYYAIERLDCVESIYELSILPRSMRYVTQIGLNLQLKDNCLCYLDTVDLEISAKIQL